MADDGLTLDLFSPPSDPPAEARAEAEGDSASPPTAAPTAAPARRESVAPAGRVPPAEREEPEVFTVSQVNRSVKRLIESRMSSLWVSGEVANWKRAGSGHRYFTLKDDRAQIRCVMWRTDAARLPIDPEDGMEIRAHGNLTLYEARGEYQFGVRRIEAAGSDGLWRIAFEKLRARLEQEGLLDSARKRPIPRFPRTVGVVTSTSGAALRDILSVVRRRAPWTRVLVMGARVQGEGAALEVAQALRTLGRSGRVDVVIVGRGGGSIEDLWAFNEEPVARAIASCPVPVISAVGHEVDVTISDLVADLRAPTPSAAGEAAVVDGAAVARYLGEAPARLDSALRNLVARRRQAVVDGIPRLRRALGRRIDPTRAQVRVVDDRLERAFRALLQRRRQRAAVRERLERAMAVLVERRRQQLAGRAGRLQALSPLATLERGYAVPMRPEGGLLRSVSEFSRGEPFTLRVVDGRVECTVDAAQPDDLPGPPPPAHRNQAP